MKSIDGNMTIRSIVEQYPETRGLFSAAGMGELVQGPGFDKVARFMTLKSALQSRGKDPLAFMQNLEEHLISSRASHDVTLLQKDQGDWNAVGVIPMAVHMKMLELFEDLRRGLKEQHGLEFQGRLASAQEGSAWIAQAYQDVTDPCRLPDVCLGRGYDFFFSPGFKERFVDPGVFNVAPDGDLHPEFNGLGLRDPQGRYNVFSIIPAVIIVRQEALKGLPLPRVWEDLLDPKYRGALCMPDCAIDLPRAVLLTLYSRYGLQAVESLADNIAQLMHPSQFVKKLRMPHNKVPPFTVMPYFFAQVVSAIPGISVIWPEDGAIAEPLYTLCKSDPNHMKADPAAVAEAVELFNGPQVACIFAGGHFPALDPAADNGLPAHARFWWPGWDFLHSHDVTELGARLENLFEERVAANQAE